MDDDQDEKATPPTRWLTAAEQDTWRAYLWAGRLLDKVMDDDLQEHGLSIGEYEILAMLSEAPRAAMRMSTLADFVVQSRSRLSHTAMRLERRDLVARRPAPGDRRGVELTLTGQGRQIVDALAPVHVASVRAHLFDVITPRQAAVLGDAMHRVRAGILGVDPSTAAPPPDEPPVP
ncbi:DNA-binding MarR family transcriptional regulator [Kineosphaera limosa]|uniref:Putative MarR family transcriptional regulator n=1 Tax=Kineosphaera limosa NBRC 100340 TaxID=1184609 RepID=K6WB65_9MICO|nr:MarR family transcriptional regulator [Kineosphaera limosa]NYE01732.1 DNA-binding MarR family transcriptional regulator [Kineosphaera limosa]GAB96470.1 putative MarR family transcriptional regulator [Kineosphaera limosa NBRC 100340]